MTDIVERLKRVRYTRERGDGPNGTYFEEPCDADDADAVVSLINPDGPEAAEEIEQLRARLAEAVEVMKMALKCTPSVIVPSDGGPVIVYDCGDPWELLRAFLAKLEKKP